jgi:PTS system nitrogen regulatory IIA component
MGLGDLISQEGIIPLLRADSKKQVLHELSRKASDMIGVQAAEIYETLLQRERLGSTGVGHGIAIPHGKMQEVNHITGLFARLEKPVDFDAIDEQKVDLVFMLLAPESAGADHLKALARISRLMREPAIIDKLRSSGGRDAIYSVLTAPAAAA